MSWKELGDLLILLNAIAALAFVLLYGLVAPFWRTPTGRNLFAFMTVLAVSLAYFAWAVQVGGVPFGLYPIRALLFSVMLLVIVQRVILLVRSQLADRKAKEAKDVEDIR